MTYTLRFDDPGADRVEFSGGKGANLAILTQAGFPVPQGFTVAGQAYLDFVAEADWLGPGVRGLPYGEAEALRVAAAALRQRLLELPLPAALEREIRERYAELGEACAVSVRSSSTMEDLASAAFAGQHETYLNVVGADVVVDSVRRCFASLWGDRAIAYRHRQGLDQLMATMAVVVQRMVQSEVSGVGFSIDPVTGELGTMILDANYGLGESVVSGEGEVDHWSLSKSDLSVRDEAIATKTRKVVSAARGTEEVALGREEADKPCLPDAGVRAVGELLRKVEAHYQFPQDIEWAFADGELYLLQARPITTIPPRWTRDESAERFPNVITPLTWDFVEAGFHESLRYSLELMHYPPFNGQWFAMHDHYIYGNQNAVEIYGKRDPLRCRTVADLREQMPRLRSEFQWVQALPVIWARDLDNYLVRIGELQAIPLQDRSLHGLWDFVKEVNGLGSDYFLPNIAISITQGALHKVLFALLNIVIGPGDARRLFDDLLAFCETKTGIINRELYDMARMIREQPGLDRLLEEHDSRAIVERGELDAFPDFAARLAKFLRDHGHREIDFDAYAPTWVEVPWVVLDNLRLILQMPLEQSSREKERDLRVRMQRAEFELYSRAPADLHYMLAEVLRMTRTYTSLDDLEHYQTTRLTLPLRRGLRAFGERLAERGVLTEPTEVFFAHAEQVEQALARDDEKGWATLGEQVRGQKAAYERDRARKPDWVLGVAEAEAEAVPGETLKGLPGSPGVAEGEVFRVLSSEDFGRFPRGAVIVARTTNPTWTPLFYSAVAVITESGGPLSHGAVTAREMKIPAVMSVKQSLDRLQNGTRVRVDGIAGVVTLLD
jgi:phosphohistidine swiveling domain-containing protein